MTVPPAPPHVVAAADQFLAAHRAGVTTDQIAHAIFRWIGKQWSSDATTDALARLDRDLEALAFHLARTNRASATEQVRAALTGVDLSAALVDRPEMHGVVVPVVTLDLLADDRVHDARQTWRHLSLAACDTSSVGVRTANVISAITMLVRHAGARVAAA